MAQILKNPPLVISAPQITLLKRAYASPATELRSECVAPPPRSGAIATRARAESTVLTNVSRHVHTDTILSSTPDSRNVVHLVQAQAPSTHHATLKSTRGGTEIHIIITSHIIIIITHHHHRHVRLNRHAYSALQAERRA